MIDLFWYLEGVQGLERLPSLRALKFQLAILNLSMSGVACGNGRPRVLCSCTGLGRGRRLLQSLFLLRGGRQLLPYVRSMGRSTARDKMLQKRTCVC